MKKFIAQGIILSHVACHNERRKAADRLGKPLEEIPLKFGSVRMAVNRFQVVSDDNTTTTYEIDKNSSEDNIKEQRLILEISYKFNYKEATVGDVTGGVIDDHEIVNELKTNHQYSLHMADCRVNERHYMKLINPSRDGAIKSYFLKAWADDIEFLAPPELNFTSNSMTPRDVIKGFNLNPQLSIV